MTILVRISLGAASMLASTAGIADEGSPGAPQTIRIVSADVVEEGAAGDRQSTFTLVQAEQGKCFAIAPPGGEGMLAGESYVVVAASDVDDALKQRLATDHPGCTLVDVVARAMKR
jgi:hypothetical protein